MAALSPIALEEQNAVKNHMGEHKSSSTQAFRLDHNPDNTSHAALWQTLRQRTQLSSATIPETVRK